MCGGGTVALGALDVARQLTGDRRGRTPKTVGDLADTLPTRVSDSDLLPLSKGQTTPQQPAPAPRAHAAGLPQPTPPLLPIRTNLGRGVGDELTALHRRPERLNHVGNHAVIELHHQLLNTSSSARCCDHRENPRIVLRT